MKRIEENPRLYLPYCQLFREELQEIIDLMTINENGPKLISGAFEFENAGELFDFLGESGKAKINITRHDPTLFFYSDGRRHATLSTPETNDASLALFRRVATAISHGSRSKPWVDREWFLLCALLFLSFGILNAARYHSSLLCVPFIGVGVVGLIMCIISFINTVRINHPHDTIFYGVRRDSQKSFWQRKRDDILASLISGVVGAALGVCGTLLTQTFTKH